MFKNYIVKLMVAVALVVAIAGGSGVVGDAVGLDVTPAVSACANGGGGGGC